MMNRIWYLENNLNYHDNTRTKLLIQDENAASLYRLITNPLDSYFVSKIDIDLKSYGVYDKDKKNIIVSNSKFSALVFKVVNDQYAGSLAYTRIYTGQLNNSTFVYNSSKSSPYKSDNFGHSSGQNKHQSSPDFIFFINKSGIQRA